MFGNALRSIKIGFIHKVALWISVITLLVTSHQVEAFSLPETENELVKISSVIAVVEVLHVNDDSDNTRVEAKVIINLLGTTSGDKITVEDEIYEDESGAPYRISGRDPYLEKGKRYLIYLVKNKRGAWITPHSASEAFEVKGDQVKKGFGKEQEPLDQRIKFIKKLIRENQQKEKEKEPESDSHLKAPEEAQEKTD